MPCILLRDRFRAVTLTLGEPFRELAEALIRDAPIPTCDPYLKSIAYGLFLHQYPAIPPVLIDRDLREDQFLLMQAVGLAMGTDFRSGDAVSFGQKLCQSLDWSEGVTADLHTLGQYLSGGSSYRAFREKVTDPVLGGIFLFLYGLYDRTTALKLTHNQPLTELVVKSLGAAGMGWHDGSEPELVHLADRLFRAWQGVWVLLSLQGG
jgi:hypothetical protein